MHPAACISICIALIFCCAEKASASHQSTEDISQSAFKKINAYREKQHLSPLIWSDSMADIAKKYSEEMALKKASFGHGGASDRSEELHKLIPDLAAYGENVAYSYPRSHQAESFVENWIKSSDHHDNIVGNFTHTGVGVFRNKDGYVYITQIFGRIEKSSSQKKEKASNKQKIIFNPPIKPRT